MIIRKFDDFNAKFKFIFRLRSDKEVAETLGIKNFTFSQAKKRDDIPYEKVVKFCKDKNVDLNWILNLKKSK